MTQRVWLAIFAGIVLAGVGASAAATVEREDIIVLAADGQHYTSYKTLRSDLDQRVLYLGPDESPQDALFIVPSDYTATSRADGGTRLRFNGGSFAIMETGRLGENVTRAGNGDLVFTSWNGETRADGHLGKWNSPGDFDSFAYSWVVPENIKIRSYSANRPGKWTRRGNTLSWHGEQVNDIAFTIRYRKTSQSERRTAAEPQSKPEPAPATTPAVPRHPAAIKLKIADMARMPLRKTPAESIDRPAEPRQTSSAPQEPERNTTHADERSLLLDRVVFLSDGRPLITPKGRIVLNHLTSRLVAGNAAAIKVTGPSVTQPRQTGGSAAKAAQVADYLATHGVDDDKIVSGPGGADDEIDPQQIRIIVRPADALTGFKP